MAVEGPEAQILGGQLDEELSGHRVLRLDVHDVAALQPKGFVNPDLSAFDAVVGDKVNRVQARGNTVVVTFDSTNHLVIGPEYGTRVLLSATPDAVPDKTHLVMVLDDQRVLTIRLTGMGSLRFESDRSLEANYLYRRDFADRPDPAKEPLTAQDIEGVLAGQTRALKAVLVGRDAVMVGISNGLFTDAVHRAGLHPKRRAGSLTPAERHRLAEAIRTAIDERTRLGGLVGFADIHGTAGGYQPSMGPAHRGGTCGRCGTPVAAVAVGGGRVYFCPSCQPG